MSATYQLVAQQQAAAYAAACRVAAARIKAAGAKMRRDALRRLDASFQPLLLQVGDRVRVSLLALPQVRRMVKSKLIGDPLPLWSTDVFCVERVRHADAVHSRTRYDVACTSCRDGGDPLPAFVGRCLAQLPSDLHKVERRYLLRIPPDATRGTMGREHPDVLPRVWAATP